MYRGSKYNGADSNGLQRVYSLAVIQALRLGRPLSSVSSLNSRAFWILYLLGALYCSAVYTFTKEVCLEIRAGEAVRLCLVRVGCWYSALVPLVNLLLSHLCGLGHLRGLDCRQAIE